MLPGNVTIKSRDTPWLEQELDVLYKDESSITGISGHGEAFLKGGTLTWQELDQNVYDVKRTISSDLLGHLHEGLPAHRRHRTKDWC